MSSSTALPADLLGVALVVLLLGIRHGFDADHIAAIDGMTCHNDKVRPVLARYCGALFSLGHGLVVVAVALGVSLLADAWHPPAWLELTGSGISIAVLLLLGGINIAAVFHAPEGEVVRLRGWRSSAFDGLLRIGHPLTVMAVGASFALSFDTFSQAALFAMTASQFGGWKSALLLGLLFTVGMVLTDGLNGYWIARLLRRRDRTALVASRVMAFTVASVSLLTAGLVLATLIVPSAQAWSEGKEVWLGVAIVAWVFLTLAIVRHRGKQTRMEVNDG
ncbi:nickel transporter [Variovorax sp. GT1P44]|uniref:HoxN/HupN/NixA family nickel/cobalt transporter n=1 Tax=Variovorax sp. GT1P44 TaxID=3443742 RepID=UPI003F47734B